MTVTKAATQVAEQAKVDALIASRGSASLAELEADPKTALELAKARPDLEPIFLVRFRSRQNKVRVEEIRGYAWPSQKIALDHLGYKAEDARLLRLEPRQAVPFPARLYATFEKTPKVLEELRTAEKAYLKAMKQAPSKPGRAERDVAPLQVAFKKLGDDVALEMWIDAAATFQRFDNPTYASKMLGNLLKLVEKDKKVDVSVLARTVLSAADDGVFNAKLYDFTWETIQKRLTVEAALGFGMRVFRRLLESGRALPTDFVKDLRNAAIRGKVPNFDALYDANVLYAAGLPSFWNTAKKSASWRDEATADHGETNVIRQRLVDLWKRSLEHQDGEAWRTEVWARVSGLGPELTAYGRTVLVERALEMCGETKPEAERLLAATLSMLSRSPRASDRERVELDADRALARIAEIDQEILWEKAGLLEDALKTATGDLTSFVVLYDLLSDIGDVIGARTIDGRDVTVVRSLPGLEAAWVGALVSTLAKTEGQRKDDDDDDDDSEDAGNLPLVPLLGEALALLSPENAAEQLAELAPLIGSRLSKDLASGLGLEAWERVLATLRALGPVGVGATTIATTKFIERTAGDTEFGHAVTLAHQLDQAQLREAAESRKLVDEALKEAVLDIYLEPTSTPLLRPEKELGDALELLDVARLPDGGYAILWGKSPKDRWSDDPVKEVALTRVSADGSSQEITGSGNLKGVSKAALWATSAGLRIVTLKDQQVQLFDAAAPSKALAKATVGEEGGYSWNSQIKPGRHVVLVTTGRATSVYDEKLATIVELDTNGSAAAQLLEGPKGTVPVVVRARWNGVEAVQIGEKKAPPLKLPDLDRPMVGVRTNSGAWAIGYRAKKSGRRRWAVLDEGQGAWTATDALPAGTLFDYCALTYDLVTADGWEELGVVVHKDTPLEVHDLAGDKLALLGGNSDTVKRVDLATGVVITDQAFTVDPSLPARLRAARPLLAAVTNLAGDVLPRAIYRDEAAVVAHILAAVAARTSGKEGLDLLGEHARPLFAETVKCDTLPKLESRLKVLEAIEAPAPEVRGVPRHVDGVRRTAARRAVRKGFEAPLDGLVFWAIDGDDPSPLVDYLLPDGKPWRGEAYSIASRLLALAQNEKTEVPIAARALRASEAILTKLGAPDQLLTLESREFSLDKDDLDDDWSLDVEELDVPRSVGGYRSDPLLWYPTGKYPKKDPPFAWSDDPEARREALARWLKDELLAPVEPREVSVVFDAGKVKIHRATAVVRGRTITIDVLTHHRVDGFDWQLVDLVGTATFDEWHDVFARLERGFEPARLVPETPATIWPSRGVVRREDLDALASGIELTREHLDRRGELDPKAWPAPEIKGVDDPRHARFVLLAWLLGQVDASESGSTNAVFEKIGKATNVVAYYYGRLRPQRGDKSGTDVKYSEETNRMRMTALFKIGSGRRGSDELVVLRPPSEIVEVMAKEIGTAEKSGRGKKS